MNKQFWNENKRMKISSSSEGNTRSGRNGKPQESQASMRQSMAPPRQAGV